MATGVRKDPINLVLVGDCGVDISATANNIIGEKRFVWWNQQDKAYQTEKAKVQGHDVMVVGNPSVRNTDIGSYLDRLTTEMKLDDFDAMLVVVSFARRISQEDKWVHTLQLLEASSGTDYIKQRGILIVVPTKKYRPDQNNGLTIEEFLQEETGVFQELRETCNNRLIAFDNRTKNQSVLQNQVKHLLDMVTEMKKEDHYKLSSSPKDLGANMDSQPETMPVNLEDRVKALKIFLKNHENIPLEKFNVKQLTEIGAKLKEYREELTEKNAGKNELTPLVFKISSLEDAIITRIDKIQIGQEDGQDKGEHVEDETHQTGEDSFDVVLRDKTGRNEELPLSMQEKVNSLEMFLGDLETKPADTFDVKQLTRIRTSLKEYREELTEMNAGKDVLTPLISKTSRIEDDVIARIDNIQKTVRKGRAEKSKRAHASTYGMGEDFITFLLVGKTGQGKSSTGNSILGEEKFKATANFTSTTKQCQREVATVQGHNVVVVDSPGLADTDIETDGGLKQLADEIINIFAAQPDGFDVILITIPYGSRITGEDKRVFQELDLLLGKEFMNHCGILVVTHRDNHDSVENGPIEEFMEKQEGEFQHLRQNRVNNRVVYFDNKTKDDSVRQAQVKELLDMAVSVKKDSQTFTPEVFLKAQKTRDEALIKAGKPVISSKTTDALTLIIRESLGIQRESKDIRQLEGIIAKLEEHLEKLKEQVEDEKILNNFLITIRNLEKAIRIKISAIEKKDNVAAAEKKIHEELSALAQLLASYDDFKSSMLGLELGPVLGAFIHPVLSNISSRFKKAVATAGAFVSWLTKT